MKTARRRGFKFALWISDTCQTIPSCLTRPEGNSPHFPIHIRQRSHLSFFGRWLRLFSRPANFGNSNRMSRGQFDLARLWPGRRGQRPRPNNPDPVRDTAHRSPARRPFRETSRGGLPSACPTALRGSADRSGWITGGTVPSFAPSSGCVPGAVCRVPCAGCWVLGRRVQPLGHVLDRPLASGSGDGSPALDCRRNPSFPPPGTGAV